MHAQRMSLTDAPEAVEAVRGVERYIKSCGLEPSLIHLIKLRASQINGCAFCVDMHTREARRDGETEQRLYLVAAWRDSPLFTDRERAALRWTECLTRLSIEGAPDDAYQDLERQFSRREIADLTTAIGVINVWNRLCVGFRVAHPVAKAAA
jgi:AhpD family alkylhydroperoxidase